MPRNSRSSFQSSFRVKPEIRILGVNDAPFLFHDSEATLLGCVFRGGGSLDGVLSARIKKDGFDATDVIASMALSPSQAHLRVIMLNGITFGGFNVVDIRRLSSLTHLPVIVVMRRKPDLAAFRSALSNLPFPNRRLDAAKSAGGIKRFKNLYFQHSIISEQSAKEILGVSITRADIPEPLRIAHMIARAFRSLK